MSALDVFKGNAFSVISLTDAVNKIPHVPGRAGQVINWNEQGVSNTGIMLEEKKGILTLIDPTPRGGPGTSTQKEKRTARTLTIPHYEVDDAVYAEEVQGVRAFGSETQVETIMAKIMSRLDGHVSQNLDPTLEYQRLGALKGIILNGDGSTLYNLFTEFGVTAQTTVYMNLAAAASASTGAIRTKCTGIVRSIANSLGGVAFTGVYGFAGDNFWDALIASKETRETFQAQEAAQLRAGAAFASFLYGGIMWENYRGATGDVDADKTMTPFVDPDEAHCFPVGVPGLFRTVYAPADYIETVNTNGLPRYARQYPMPNGKGVSLESQMNALSYCVRPRALIKADIAAAAS